MIGFALCHGWAFDARAMVPLQAALQQRLPDVTFASFDLGFTGQPHAPVLAADIPWIALGHSWGFPWLLQQTQPWRAAISINGFTRFCRRPGQPEGTPLRLLDAMLARLREEPAATVQDFLQRCDISSTPGMALDQTQLLTHLERFRELDVALPACPVLALASEEDVIVPPPLATVCFAHEDCALHWFTGGHTRLLREPAGAAAAIAAFVEALDA